jgi:hypothetical protein
MNDNQSELDRLMQIAREEIEKASEEEQQRAYELGEEASIEEIQEQSR